MSIPSKFDLMRHQRRRSVRRQAMERLDAERAAFAFEDSKDVEHALREIDMDAIHKKQNKVRRWWWPITWRTT